LFLSCPIPSLPRDLVRSSSNPAASGSFRSRPVGRRVRGVPRGVRELEAADWVCVHCELMLTRLLAAGILLYSSSALHAQVFEVGVSGGRALFTGSNANLGTASTDPASSQYQVGNGFRLTFRITFNQGRFFGHEIGYAYNHTSLIVPAISTPTLNGVTTTPAQTVGVPIHQGFYDFLAYATPEGLHVRPFGAAGVNFSSFFPPGTSIYSGNQVTKYGFNYGGGLKVRVTSIWGVRLDVRWYNTSKPFGFFNQSGRLQQLEASGGVTLNL